MDLLTIFCASEKIMLEIMFCEDTERKRKNQRWMNTANSVKCASINHFSHYLLPFNLHWVHFVFDKQKKTGATDRRHWTEKAHAKY